MKLDYLKGRATAMWSLNPFQAPFSIFATGRASVGRWNTAFTPANEIDISFTPWLKRIQSIVVLHEIIIIGTERNVMKMAFL